ncbi:MAG: secondary thiamine-phosphate synthase enzyme YjbQ [Alphaproteobacteria bacterium]|nr:secondary thiamine-phosphate synthase enzyme YjbQ [Alphaproteobacteria bacterium]
MKQAQEIILINTQEQGFQDITQKIDDWIKNTKISTGLLTVFLMHTSASLTIQENADPDVMFDFQAFLKRTVPEDLSLYKHTMEGIDDMPAHIRTSLTDISLSIPVSSGRMTLGTWQGLYLCEHRARGHSRHLSLHLIGE